MITTIRRLFQSTRPADLADSDDPIICLDCKHCIPGGVDSKCGAPKNFKLDLVTGEQVPAYIYCSTHRQSQASDTCGARWFEPKGA